MRRFVQKPPEIQAEQFDGTREQALEFLEMVFKAGGQAVVEGKDGAVTLRFTFDGFNSQGHLLRPGDWFVNQQGTFRTLGDELFQATYLPGYLHAWC